MAPIEPQILFNERKKQCKSQLSFIYLQEQGTNQANENLKKN